MAAAAYVLERCVHPSLLDASSHISTEYPTSWSIEAEPEKEDEDEDDDDDEGEAQPKPEKPSTEPVPSQAYTEFLQFLATGCSGSPAQGYPTILIVLSTIPPRVSPICFALSCDL